MTGTAPGAKPPSEDDTKATQKSRINKKSGRDGKSAGEWAAENNAKNGPNRFLPAGAPALAAAKGKIRSRPAPVSPLGPFCGKNGIEFLEFFRRRALIRDSLAPRQPRGLSRCAALYQQSQAALGGARRSGAAVSPSFFPLSNKEICRSRSSRWAKARGRGAPTDAGAKTGRGKPAAENEKSEDDPQNKAANRGAVFRAKPEEQKKAKEKKAKACRAGSATAPPSRALNHSGDYPLPHRGGLGTDVVCARPPFAHPWRP